MAHLRAPEIYSFFGETEPNRNPGVAFNNLRCLAVPPYNYPPSQRELALLYWQGLYTKRSFLAGYRLFRSAAQDGDYRARDKLAAIHTQLFFLGYILLSFLTALGLGAYLSTAYIAPLLTTALLTAGMVPWAAFIMVIGVSGALIFGLNYFFNIFSSPLKLFIKIMRPILYKTGFELSEVIYYATFIMGTLASFGFGLYIAIQLIPLLLSSLAIAGVPHGMGLLIGIAAGFLICSATIDLLSQPSGLISIYWDLLAQIVMNKLSYPMLLLHMVVGAAGIGLAIYLSVLLAPLLTSALLTAPIFTGCAGLIMAVVGLGLITFLGRAFSSLGTLIGWGIERIKRSKEPEDILPKIETVTCSIAPELLIGAIVMQITPDIRGETQKLSDNLMSHLGLRAPVPR